MAKSVHWTGIVHAVHASRILYSLPAGRRAIVRVAWFGIGFAVVVLAALFGWPLCCYVRRWLGWRALWRRK